MTKPAKPRAKGRPAAAAAPASTKPQGETLLVNGVEARMGGKLKKIGGSQSDDFNTTVADQATHSNWFGNSSQEDAGRLQIATISAMAGMAPQSEIEGMIAAQMLATHNAAMECFRRAMIQSQPMEGREQNLTQANRLTRSFTTLVHALDKHRGKGNQTVRVEHVHVYEGGQAIVGPVTHEKKIAAEAAVRRVTHESADVLPGVEMSAEDRPAVGRAQGEGER